MPEIQLVNDSGYDALLTLAESEPQLFIRSNPEELRRRMERAGRVEHGPDAELYGERLILPVSLADLNRLQKDGPTSDAEYAPSMRQAAGSSVVQSANRLLWTTINCFVLPQYVPVRWESSNLAQAPRKISCDDIGCSTRVQTGANGMRRPDYGGSGKWQPAPPNIRSIALTTCSKRWPGMSTCTIKRLTARFCHPIPDYWRLSGTSFLMATSIYGRRKMPMT